MKVVDKMNAGIQQGRPFFSFEFFPPRTDEVRRSRKRCQDAGCMAVYLLIDAVMASSS